MRVSNKRKKHVYRSITEVEKAFFPKSHEEKTASTSIGAQDLGITLVRQSLEKLKEELIK